MIEVRPATVDDADGWCTVSTAALPYLVNTSEGIVFDMNHAAAHARSVATDGERVLGTAKVSTEVADDGIRAALSMAVHPGDHGRGVGNQLLSWGCDHARSVGATRLETVVNGDDHSVEVARHWGFSLDRGHTVSAVDPRTVLEPAPAPDGLRIAASADCDPHQLWDTHQAVALDDPSGLSRPVAFDVFVTEWLNHPCTRNELSRAILYGDTCIAFSTLTAGNGRGWSAMTGTRASHRGRGLGLLAKEHTLRAAADAGMTVCATANDAANAPMLAVNSRLGYRPVATMWGAHLALS